MIHMSKQTELQPPNAEHDAGQTRQFRRASRPADRILGGVSSAAATYLGLKTIHIRFLFLLLTPFFLLGVLIYVPLWFLSPDQDNRVLLRSGAQSTTESILASLFAMVTVIAFFTWFPSGEPLSGTAISVAFLVGIATLLLSAPSRLSDDDDAINRVHVDEVLGDAPTAPAESATEPVFDEPVVSQPVLPPNVPTTTVTSTRRSTQTRPQRPPRPRPFMGPLIIGFSVLVAGIGLILRGVTDIPIRLSDVLIAVLGVMGMGLLITTWFGRARGVILLGLLLIPITLMSATVDRLGIGNEFGNDVYQPTRFGDIPTSVNLDGGVVEVDLRLLEDASIVPTAPIDLDIAVKFGAIRVFVPATWNLNVDSTTRFGSQYIFDQSWTQPEYTEEELEDESIATVDPPWWYFNHSRQHVLQWEPTVTAFSEGPTSLSERTDDGVVFRSSRQTRPDAPTLNVHTSSIIADIEIIRVNAIESE